MNAKPKARRDRFPIVIKRGSCSVKIYRDRKPTGTYYRVCYHIGGKRERLNFSDLDKAKAKAEAQACELSRNEAGAVQITAEDRLAYVRALQAIKGFDLSVDAA